MAAFVLFVLIRVHSWISFFGFYLGVSDLGVHFFGETPDRLRKSGFNQMAIDASVIEADQMPNAIPENSASIAIFHDTHAAAVDRSRKAAACFRRRIAKPRIIKLTVGSGEIKRKIIV